MMLGRILQSCWASIVTTPAYHKALFYVLALPVFYVETISDKVGDQKNEVLDIL